MEERENLLGRALREARLAKGMTQAALGEKLGYSAMAISHFENGARPIKAEELIRASEVLGRDLVDGTSNSKGRSPVLFRATNMRAGAGAIERSLQSFDRYIEKKYGDDARSKKID